MENFTCVLIRLVTNQLLADLLGREQHRARAISETNKT